MWSPHDKRILKKNLSRPAGVVNSRGTSKQFALKVPTITVYNKH